ncbi:nitroreductase family protein [Wolffia australiana]
MSSNGLPYLNRLVVIRQGSPPTEVAMLVVSSRLGPSSAIAGMHRRRTSSAAASAAADRERRRRQAETYHDQSKHSLSAGFARGPRGLDWANQPSPFLRFVSSPLVPLRQSPISDSPPYSSLFSDPPPPQPISHASLSELLFDSMALSAWKKAGSSTWSLRVNPSSGNLHPTEAYLLSPPISSSSPFVAHYAPREHALEVRAAFPRDFLPQILPQSFLVGFSSIFWRESWKYGERAFRYCNHDVGHAVAAVAVAARALGWDARLVDGLGSTDLRNLFGLGLGLGLGFPNVEAEHPDCALLVFPADSVPVLDYASIAAQISSLPPLNWIGKPNALSEEHVRWDAIYETAEAVEKPTAAGDSFSVEEFRCSGLLSRSLYRDLTVREVVRGRRSAVDMDGATCLERDGFYQILLRCLPSGVLNLGEKQGKQQALPFRVFPWDAEVHAALFVHRVVGLAKGLYFLVRNEEHFDSLRSAMRAQFEWVKPEGCPDGLPLYRLAAGDCQNLARQLSCHQDIAADGCFSLGMVARFDPVLSERGAWMYPRLFWETGALGQVLYLEAHAVGISATGIGCYFDDAVHDVLGLKGKEFQSLYHFTVGGAVQDKRIMNLPAYPGPDINA